MKNISKDRIDITMTAVLRPSILSETLLKIKQHVCRGEEERYRLIINVDPIGENVEPIKVVKVAKKNFNNVIFNIPKKPSFPKAVKWVWSKVEAPYIFHWEDDVDILRDIDVDDMISILNKYDKLSSLRLFKMNTPNKKSFYTFRSLWEYHEEGFYIAQEWKEQFGLNPSLIKKEFISEAVTKMVDNINPEKQFRYNQNIWKV